MHAGIPCFSEHISQVLRLGANQGDTARMLESAGGQLLANGMATLLKLGFAFILRQGVLDREQSEKARSFFENNLVFHDPYAENNRRYYQGKFLIRTRKPDDQMNVLLRFCPEPDNLYMETPFGETLNPLAVVDTSTLSEAEADQVAQDPDKVDLVISFRDSRSILGLIGRQDIDIVGLLLENLVQMEGNMGHLFKLGAIAAGIERMLNLSGTENAEEEFEDY